MNGATLFLVTALVYLTAKKKIGDFTALVHPATTSDTGATATAGAGAAGASAATASTPAASNSAATTQAQISAIGALYGENVSFQ